MIDYVAVNVSFFAVIMVVRRVFVRVVSLTELLYVVFVSFVQLRHEFVDKRVFMLPVYNVRRRVMLDLIIHVACVRLVRLVELEFAYVHDIVLFVLVVRQASFSLTVRQSVNVISTQGVISLIDL